MTRGATDDCYFGQAEWAFPAPVKYGPGRVRELPQLLASAGLRRPLVVTDRGTAGLEIAARLVSLLEKAGHAPELFAEVSPNPRDSEVEAGKEAYSSGGHDSIVAFGGGSGMDAGKAVSLIAESGLELWEFDELRPGPETRQFVPVVCIPTTAGTGAETDSTSMITHTGRAMKLCVWHREHRPMAAILDPELTLGLPRNLTAWTGCDALVHAIEAYCVPKLHPQCDGIALEALRLIGQALPEVVDKPDDLGLRGRMLVGSCLAGVSFLKGLGLVHSISHMAGAIFGMHHGLTNAVILPAVLQFNADTIRDKIPQMAHALGVSAGRFDAFYAHICSLLDRLEIPVSLEEIGVTADRAEEIACKAMHDTATTTNPRTPSRREMEGLVRKTISGAR